MDIDTECLFLENIIRFGFRVNLLKVFGDQRV